jgi:hypothetical protein
VADIVAKVTEQMLWNWNLKQSNRDVRTFESMLRVRVLPPPPQVSSRAERRKRHFVMAITASGDGRS